MRYRNSRLVVSILILLMINISASADDYWQQVVNYRIDVTLDDVKHELNGSIDIEYFNASPDELEFIYIHLWPNAYKDHETAFARQKLENGSTKFNFSDPSGRGYIDHLDFKVDNEHVRWEYDRVHKDICKIFLNVPLRSNQKISISTPFHVKIPNSFSRLGHTGQSYQITQWYPKPAVYDSKGWHPMPYLDQGEFYSEFGSYDVYITVPKNYVVGATGDMRSSGERAWLEEIVKETENLTEVDQDDLSFPPSSKEIKTLNFFQKNVHDFAWFADKRFHVLKGAVTLPESGREVETWTMFTNHDFEYWKNSIEYMNDAILFYSKHVGEYPYNQATALEGALSAGAGMEYPNVTIIGNSRSAKLLERVIVHEVGHNWFYGILGSNERDHPWLDEGINSYYENRYFKEKYESIGILDIEGSTIGKILGIENMNEGRFAVLFQEHLRRTQPIQMQADEFTSTNYGMMVYFKTAAILEYLESFLGTEEFDAVMKKYYDRWKFKHPYPEDIQDIFEETGKYLEWFFDHLLKTTYPLDYKIVKVIKEDVTIGSTSYVNIRIKNGNSKTISEGGKVKGPFSISGMKNDTIRHTIWYDGFFGTMDVLFPAADFDAYRINALGTMPEFNNKNNTIRTKGLFKKFEPLCFKPVMSFYKPEKTEIVLSPVVGWNNYDKTMVGIAIYNTALLSRRFEYVLVPMYGTGSAKIVGTGNIGYNFYPKTGPFHNINLSVGGASFNYLINYSTLLRARYNKVSPSVNLTFRKKDPRTKRSTLLRFRSVYLNKGLIVWDTTSKSYQNSSIDYQIQEINFEHYNSRALNPYSFSLNLQQGEGFVKASIESRYKFSLAMKKKGVTVRLFAGSFLMYSPTQLNRFNRDVRFRMSGFSPSLFGPQDYLFDEVFLGRTDRMIINGRNELWAQQVVERDGGFKIITPIGRDSAWIAAININADLPIKLPIGLYGDFGISETSLSKTKQKFYYDLGIVVKLIRGIFEIYFPLGMSEEMKNYFNPPNSVNDVAYTKRVSFILNVKELNPLKLLKEISF